MKTPLNDPEKNINDLVLEIKSIVSSSGDLNQHKDDLAQIIDKVDFILDKHDDVYNQYIEAFIAMGQFKFGKRLPLNNENDSLINFFNNGLNMLNEEFEASAIRKIVLRDFVKGLNLQNTVVVVTTVNGFIYFVYPNTDKLTGFNEQTLLNQNINIFFTDFKSLQNQIKEQGSINNIETELIWKDEIIPTMVDVIECRNYGQIESIIYILKVG